MKVFVSTSSFGAHDTTPLDRLKQAGVDVVLNPYKRVLTSEESQTLLSDIDGLIAGTEALSRDVLMHAPKLRVISRCGAGLENVDMNAASELHMQVFNTPDAPTQAVAELTIGLILTVLRHLSRSDAQIRRGDWKKHMGGLLQGKTVGIIGFGRIGQRVATLLKGFDVCIMVTDPLLNEEAARAIGAHHADMETLLKKSDVITIHVPASTCLIDKRALSLTKPNAILINTARGGCVDEQALFDALRDGRLGGAGLDVFSGEPYSGPLSQLENIVLTPHIGSYAHECRVAMELEAAQHVLEGLGLIQYV